MPAFKSQWLSKISPQSATDRTDRIQERPRYSATAERHATVPTLLPDRTWRKVGPTECSFFIGTAGSAACARCGESWLQYIERARK